MKSSSEGLLRILLVEDNPDDAFLVQASLDSHLGATCSVRHVSRVADAESVLREHAFDVLLIDLSLPDARGTRSVEVLIAAAPDTTVIALTGLDDDQMVDAIMSAGAQDYLVKGQGTPQMMVRAIRAAMVRKALLVSLEQAHRSADFRAMHDPLTGLPNRALFADRLRTALRADARPRQGVGIAYLDLDGFKAVNDRLGHAVGDQLLQHVARELASVLRTGDTLARLGGDEFAVLLQGTATLTGLEAMLAHGRAHLRDHALCSGGSVIAIELSHGVARSPDDGETAEALLEVADARMYAWKRAVKEAAEITQAGAEPGVR